MVIRTVAPDRPVFRPARLLASLTTTISACLAAIDHAERSRRNALAASIELSSAAAERREVDAFLADYASARTQPHKRAS